MIAAGILRMDFLNYCRNDGLAALITTTVWLALGYYFGSLLQVGLNSLVSVLSICSILFILLGGFFAMRLINAEERRMDTHGI
jgi:membrane protein DedA with SNARE-associated domain